jgi:hypothetical protein
MASQKGLGSAGTRDKAVERTEEGTAASASGNAQVRAQFDAATANGIRRNAAKATIDTSGTSFDATDGALNVKRGDSAAW